MWLLHKIKDGFTDNSALFFKNKSKLKSITLIKNSLFCTKCYNYEQKNIKKNSLLYKFNKNKLKLSCNNNT